MNAGPASDPSQSPNAVGGGVDTGTSGRTIGSELKRPWLLANFLGFTIAFAVGAGVLSSIVRPYFGSDVSAMEAARIQGTGGGAAGAIIGTVLGVAQWLVLRRAIRAGWWVPATFVGWVLAAAIGSFSAGGSTSTIGPVEGPLPPVTILVTIPLVVFLLSAGQWLVLRREFEGAGGWLLVNVVALLAGLVGGLIVAKLVPWLASTQFPSARVGAVAGAIAGPIYGYLTWAFLAELRRREVRAPSRGPG